MTLRCGFIGLGNIGRPMAEHYPRAGFVTTVYDTAPEPVRALCELGARDASSPRALAGACDFISICVGDDAQVCAVLDGNDGVIKGAARGAIVAIHSTVRPRTVCELAARANEHGVRVLDACVTGGAARARSRELTYLVGGDASALEALRPVLESNAAHIIHAGATGSGAKLKLCINLLTYIQWAAAFESFTLARAAGLDAEIFEEAGRANGQLTELMTQYLLGHKLPPSAVTGDDYQALMRGHQNIAEKDLALALELAREAGAALPVGGLVSQLMAQLYNVRAAHKSS